MKSTSKTGTSGKVNRTSSKHITALADNEIFVFGSNRAGEHRGGAARQAHKYFGAVWGQGIGLHGQSYAIPTMGGDIQQYVDDFIAFAKAHPDLRFLVTEIGCGIAGYSYKDITPFFRDAVNVENIHLPERFWRELNRLKKFKSDDPFETCGIRLHSVMNWDGTLDPKAFFEMGSHESRNLTSEKAIEVLSGFVLAGYEMNVVALQYLEGKVALNDMQRISCMQGTFEHYTQTILLNVLKNFPDTANTDWFEHLAKKYFYKTPKEAMEAVLLRTSSHATLRKAIDDFMEAVKKQSKIFLPYVKH
ncbi:hypothetical protein FACS189430_02160 [Bacteroidia bacterium]|nr:hypothetical protein FACS189430_02160 [Bacteroidia bacterium]